MYYSVTFFSDIITYMTENKPKKSKPQKIPITKEIEMKRIEAELTDCEECIGEYKRVQSQFTQFPNTVSLLDGEIEELRNKTHSLTVYKDKIMKLPAGANIE